MYFIKRPFIALCFSGALLTSLQAQNIIREDGKALNTITTAVPLLMIAPDSRASGMGDAGVASTPDPSAMHWNPAKFAFIENDMGVTISYTPWLTNLVDDIYLSYLSGYYKLEREQTIAASLRYFSLGNIAFTDKDGGSLGNFKPNEFALDFAYARKLSEHFSGGVSLRYIYSNLTGGTFVGGAESHPGRSVATDVSAYYTNDLQIGGKEAILSFGANISNIGTKISYTETIDRDFIPINFRIGPSLKMDIDDFNTIEFAVDVNKLLVPTPPLYGEDPATGETVIIKGVDPNTTSVVSGMFGSFSDAPGGFDEEMREFNYAMGVEYWYDKQFAIRGGYFYENETKGNRKYFTLGAGLKYNVFGLDLSYLIPTDQRNPLENTLRFSLTFDFEGFKNQNKTNSTN